MGTAAAQDLIGDELAVLTGCLKALGMHPVKLNKVPGRRAVSAEAVARVLLLTCTCRRNPQWRFTDQSFLHDRPPAHAAPGLRERRALPASAEAVARAPATELPSPCATGMAALPLMQDRRLHHDPTQGRVLPPGRNDW